MDIKNGVMKKICEEMKVRFSNFLNEHDIDIEYLLINMKSKKINIISSSYDWISLYFENDLDLSIQERLSIGFKCWNDYSEGHREILYKISKKKIDICFKREDVFEIFSIDFVDKLSMENILTIYTWRAVIADYAHCVWNKNKNNYLPLRGDILLPKKSSERRGAGSLNLLDIHGYMRFGDVRLTYKEIMTIQLLLSYRKIKEISAVQGCSEASEHKRIQRIKEKLNCPYASSSGLFDALKMRGVTLACLDNIINHE